LIPESCRKTRDINGANRSSSRPVGRMLLKGNKRFRSQKWASDGNQVYFRHILEDFCMTFFHLEKSSWGKWTKRKVVHSVERSIDRLQWIYSSQNTAQELQGLLTQLSQKKTSHFKWGVYSSF